MQHRPKIEGVALYARVATKDMRQDTENQLLQLHDCRKRGWQIAAEYVDHESGGTPRRIAAEPAISPATAHRIVRETVW